MLGNLPCHCLKAQEEGHFWGCPPDPHSYQPTWNPVPRAACFGSGSRQKTKVRSKGQKVWAARIGPNALVLDAGAGGGEPSEILLPPSLAPLFQLSSHFSWGRAPVRATEICVGAPYSPYSCDLGVLLVIRVGSCL